MVNSQVKSKERVANHAEVFTAEREVKAMCDLVKRIESRFLEPACGNGNFLSEILQRKLDVVKQRYGKSTFDYESYSVLAVTSLYGVEILEDNVIECRERLFSIWQDRYIQVNRNNADEQCQKIIKYILKKNILCGDALTLLDNNGEPIIFSEWSFIGNNVKRRDFRLDVLLNENSDGNLYDKQMSIFIDEANNSENWMIDPITQKPIPKPVKEYPIVNYRRITEYE